MAAAALGALVIGLFVLLITQADAPASTAPRGFDPGADRQKENELPFQQRQEDLRDATLRISALLDAVRDAGERVQNAPPVPADSPAVDAEERARLAKTLETTRYRMATFAQNELGSDMQIHGHPYFTEFLDELHAIGQPAVDVFSDLMFNSPYAMTRGTAALILSRMRHPAAVEPMVRAVRETLDGAAPPFREPFNQFTWNVRLYSVEGLAYADAPAAIPTLERVMREERGPNYAEEPRDRTRRLAARGLARLKQREGIDFLLSQYRDYPGDNQRRFEAVVLLSDLAEPALLPFFHEIVTRPQAENAADDYRIRTDALKAIENIDSRDSLPTLQVVRDTPARPVPHEEFDRRLATYAAAIRERIARKP
ncbi:MAG: hypothetical protein HY719_01670 [Planctomycetes bacterium]|nr:hypothetical protein [Planctomycetota bacterium]